MSATASDPIVIVGMARTPLGAFQGAFSDMTAAALGARAIAGALTRSGLAADDISEVLMGCVLPAGRRRVRRRLAPGCRRACRAPRSTRCAARA